MHLVSDGCMCLDYEYRGYRLYTTSLRPHPKVSVVAAHLSSAEENTLAFPENI